MNITIKKSIYFMKYIIYKNEIYTYYEPSNTILYKIKDFLA